MKKINDINRKSLKFPILAKEALSFLQNWGYLVEYQDDTIVKFTGPFGRINVYHGRSSYEIGIEFGPENSNQSKMFSLDQLIKLTTGTEENDYYNPCATSEESVHRFLLEQAELLKKYGVRIFEGDLRVWFDLEDIRKRNAFNMEIESKLKNARSLSDKAFKSRRFSEVVKYLSEVEAWLTPTEKKKLSYARDHIGHPSKT